MLDTSWNTHASRIQDRINALAAITEERGMITRTFLSEATLRANQVVAGWMGEAGLTTSEDRVANLLGQLPAGSSGSVFLLGSHLDSVRNAGRFDGSLGVVLAIEAVEILRSAGVILPFPLGVAGFSDEEGVRFQSASHAGTTPARLRRDALAGAAEFIREVEKGSEKFGGLMATVGQLAIEPNVSNVVPARVTHTLDVRHQSDSVLNEASACLEDRAGTIARGRYLDLTWEILQATTARECDPALSRRLLGVVERVTGSTRLLPSGAGHDAGILASMFPVAMLFVRCREGLSHHPDEFVSLEDIRVALQVTVEFLRTWELS